jgi:threonine/homoserine/homoserine lactone efflux protein
LTHGRLAGFVSGLGAATADFGYACIAAFGISAALSKYLGAEHGVRIVGATFLLYLGVKTFFDKPAEASATAPAGTLMRCFSTTLVLTITNPLTVLSFAAMLTALGATTSGGASLAMGVFVGSAIWWLTLSAITGMVRHRMDEPRLKVLNRGAGVLLVGFAVAAIFG